MKITKYVEYHYPIVDCQFAVFTKLLAISSKIHLQIFKSTRYVEIVDKCRKLLENYYTIVDCQYTVLTETYWQYLARYAYKYTRYVENTVVGNN